MSAEIRITDQQLIGENDHGYRFLVGKIGDRWVGFADGDLGDGKRMLFMFPAISEDYQMGLLDRELVIKLTGAIAQSVEHGYGGIARWFVPEELRGKPEDFTCEHCESVGCRGSCEREDYFGY
jgi:hypothetical protein